MSAGALRGALLHGLQAIERCFDRAFGNAANPLRHLGALGFFLFWIVAASGIATSSLMIQEAEESAVPITFPAGNASKTVAFVCLIVTSSRLICGSRIVWCCV